MVHIHVVHFFFISNPIFQLSLELLSEVPRMRLKIAMKLLTFFGDYRLKKQKLGKIEDLRLKLLRISDLRLGSC